MKKSTQGHRVPLYVPADAAAILDRIGRIARQRRWSRNKTIVEILRRSLRARARVR